MEIIEDIITGEQHCPKCGYLMREIRPRNDKHLVIKKEHTVRFLCPCGYYEDRVIVDPKDFKDNNV